MLSRAWPAQSQTAFIFVYEAGGRNSLFLMTIPLADETASERAPGVKSALRAVRLLEALADRDGMPARLRDLANELDAPRSSVHALLRTLTDSGWVRTDVTGTLYALGLRALLVGGSFLEADPYVRVVRPALADLRDELGETMHLARLDGDRIIYLITQESSHQARKISRVGRWLPAHTTSLGKAVLAARGDEPAGPLEKVTEHTITSPSDLAAELELTRQRDYAEDNEEGTVGLRCLGVALRYTTPVTDAISCSVPSSRLTAKRQEQIVAALQRARVKIEDSAPLQGTF